jgi:hypothetical protein
VSSLDAWRRGHRPTGGRPASCLVERQPCSGPAQRQSTPEVLDAVDAALGLLLTERDAGPFVVGVIILGHDMTERVEEAIAEHGGTVTTRSEDEKGASHPRFIETGGLSMIYSAPTSLGSAHRRRQPSRSLGGWWGGEVTRLDRGKPR